MTIQTLHLRSNVQGKEPVAGTSAGQLPVGSIAINFNKDEPFLTIQDSAGAIRRIAGIKVGAAAPATPTAGEAWLDTTVATKPVFKVHDGTAWQGAGSGVSTGATTPASPAEGDLWVDTSVSAKPSLKVYNGTAFVVVTPDATDTVKGVVELADATEATAGTDTTRAVTPAGLNAALAAQAGSATAPSAPTTGTVWVDASTTPSVIKVYDGTNWIAQAGATVSGATPPATPATGTLWIDTSSSPNVAKIYDGTNWVTATPSGAATAAIANDAKYATKAELQAEDLWDRTGTELSPHTAGDSVFTTGSVKVGGTTAKPNITVNDASGRLLVGTSSARSNVQFTGSNRTPTTQFETAVASSNNGLSLINNSASGHPSNIWIGASKGSSIGSNTLVSNQALGNINFVGADGTNLIHGARIHADTDGTAGSGDLPARLVFSTTPSGSDTPQERMRLDSKGRLLLGTNTALEYVSGGTITKGFQNAGLSELTGISQFRYGPDISPSILTFSKSRGATIGAQGLVSKDDSLGSITFHGSDGTAFRRAGSITCEVDGTPGADDMPGRFVFSTTPDGKAAPEERLRITADGKVGIGTTSPGDILHINSSSGAAGLRVSSSTNSAGVKLLARSDGTGSQLAAYGTDSYLSLYTTDSTNTTRERVRIDSKGRLLVGTTSSTMTGGTVQQVGDLGFISKAAGNVATNGTIDFTINDTGGSYQGFLLVSNMQASNASARTQTTYAVLGRGTSATTTQLATVNGSSGASFTISYPSNGVIRFTNKHGAPTNVSVNWLGNRGW